jgi:hypothetical protein
LEILKRLGKVCAVFFTLGIAVCKGEQVVQDKFGYLNNNESPVIIDPSQAQDLLNVDVTPGGASIKSAVATESTKRCRAARRCMAGIISSIRPETTFSFGGRARPFGPSSMMRPRRN